MKKIIIIACFLLLPAITGSALEEPRYAPGEVIIKFKEGVDPQAVFQQFSATPNIIQRVHSIRFLVSKFKKDYKLERDSSGWYSFLDKNYKELDQIPDEEIFREVYKDMAPERQGLYRKYTIKLPEGLSVEEAVAKLRNDPDVEEVSPNFLRKVSSDPNDPFYPNQWALTRIQTSTAWDLEIGERAVIIAIIDTGVDYNHQDLAGNVWHDATGFPGADFVDIDIAAYEAEGYVRVPGEDYQMIDNDPMDTHGHGTHISGIASAVGNNGIGISGVSQRCSIMPVRCGFAIMSPLGSIYGFLDDVAIAQGIVYAIDNGANVISMSFGGYEEAPFNDELELAYANNIILVAAAGNDNVQEKHYPAASKHVIAVAATDESDQKAGFSNFGSWIDIAAPGVNIFSTIPANRYATYSGTSMACPVVSGLAGLVLSKKIQSVHPLSNREAEQILRVSVDDLGETGKDRIFGHGRINAQTAIRTEVYISSPQDTGYLHLNNGYTGIVLGSAFAEIGFQRYELRYVPENNPNQSILLTQSYIPVRDMNQLGAWNIAGLSDGKYILTLTVNTVQRVFTNTINVTIDNVNEYPQFIDLGNKGVVVGRPFAFKVEAADPDDPSTPWGQLTYSAQNLPPGASFDPAAQVFSWQPAEADKGTYMVTFKVRDASGLETQKVIAMSTVLLEETQVVANFDFHGHLFEIYSPSISGDKIVWADRRSMYTTDLYMYDMATGTERQITNSYYNDFPSIYFNPKTGKGVLAWISYANQKYELYMLDLADSNAQPILVTDQNNPMSPSVYGDNITWQETVNGIANIMFCEHSRATGQNKITRLTNDGIDQRGPDIYNNRIAWTMTPGSGDRDIIMCDYNPATGTGTIRNITNTPSIRKGSVAVYNNRIVWYDGRSGSADIYMYDLTTSTESQVTGARNVQDRPDIYEDNIVWEDSRNNDPNVYGDNYDIYMKDLLTGNEIQVTDNAGNQRGPKIYKNRVMWLDDRRDAPGPGLYMATINIAPVITYVTPTLLYQGSILTINGTNFGHSQTPGSTVQFSNGVDAIIVSWSNTEIRCSAPQGANSGPLKVITDGGISNAVNIVIDRIPATGTVILSNNYPSPNLPVIFTTTYTDADGYGNIAYAYLLVDTPSGVYGQDGSWYNALTNKLYLRSADHTRWLGGYAPGSNNQIDNGLAVLDCSKTYVTGSGNTMCVRWVEWFKPAYTGQKTIYLKVADRYGAGTGWIPKRTVTIMNYGPQAGTLTASIPSGSYYPGQEVVFTAIGSDLNGADDIRCIAAIWNTPSEWTAVVYDSIENNLYMLNDTGTAWIGGYPRGSNNIIKNSYMELDCGGTTVSKSGNTVRVNFKLRLYSTMQGTKNLYINVSDRALLYSGWGYKGTYRILSDIIPQTGTVTPSSGTFVTNTPYTFNAVYSDLYWANDIKWAAMCIWSTPPAAGRYGGVYYDAVNNLLYVSSDDGTRLLGGVAPGTNTTLYNSYAILDCANTTVTRQGSILTVNWKVRFKTPIRGTRNIYSNVQCRAGATSGWQQRGAIRIY